MKKLLSLLFLLPVLTTAQNLLSDNFPVKEGKIVYSEVVPVDSSMTANDLYLNAKNWLASAFNFSKSALQTDDKEAKLIILKGVTNVPEVEGIDQSEWFLLKLELKNSRYKYSLFEIETEGYPFEIYFDIEIKKINRVAASKDKRDIPLAKEYMENFIKYNQSLNAKFIAIISSLKASMSKKADNNW
jgi:hypothetical protein